MFYFPISFNSTCYNVSVTTHGTNDHFVGSITKTYWGGDIRYGDSYKVGWWIAIGV
ncbi:MAG: hypothetical protein SPF22_07675 [Candidatus Onthovivens sp.]|nr:hypothetical protein [Candidatus Onthovivens sp.]